MAKRIVDFEQASPKSGDFLLAWDAAANDGQGGTRKVLVDDITTAPPSEEDVELPPVLTVANIEDAPGRYVVGNRYLIWTAPTGAWVGRTYQIAEWDGLEWIYTIPAEGNIVYVTGDLSTRKFRNAIWVLVSGTALRQNGQPASVAGIKAGTTNNTPFTVKTNNLDRVQVGTDGVMRYLEDVSAAFDGLSVPTVDWVLANAGGGLGAGQGLTENLLTGNIDLGGILAIGSYTEIAMEDYSAYLSIQDADIGLTVPSFLGLWENSFGVANSGVFSRTEQFNVRTDLFEVTIGSFPTETFLAIDITGIEFLAPVKFTGQSSIGAPANAPTHKLLVTVDGLAYEIALSPV